MVRICTDLGLPDAQEYANQLKKAEKMKEVQQAVRNILCIFTIGSILHTNNFNFDKSINSFKTFLAMSKEIIEIFYHLVFSYK